MKLAGVETMSYRDRVVDPSLNRQLGPAWLGTLRTKALEKLKSVGLPNRSHESWKYLHLEGLLEQNYGEPTREIPRDLDRFEKDKAFVFINGILQPFSFPVSNAVKVIELSKATREDSSLAEYLEADLEKETNAFGLANTLYFDRGAVIFIAAAQTPTEPIPIRWVTASFSEPFAYHPRLLVIAEEGSKASIIIEHQSFGKMASLVNGVSEFFLMKNSNLKVTEIFQKGGQGFELIQNRCFLKHSSRLEWKTFAQEGPVRRQEIRAVLQEPEAVFEVQSLSLIQDEGRFYQHSIADHESGHCQSRQFFKNILAGKAQAECNSLVHVVRGAQKTESNQLNRNLLLTEGTRVYSRPQLKIYSDDVQCAHGSATGQMDAEEVFYLKSRGLTDPMARLLLGFGFAEEILAKIEPASLRESIEREVKEALRALFASKGI